MKLTEEKGMSFGRINSNDILVLVVPYINLIILVKFYAIENHLKQVTLQHEVIELY